MAYRPNFVPGVSNAYARPVQGQWANGLTGVETPGGKGVLAFNSETANHCYLLPMYGKAISIAVLDSPNEFTTWGVATSANKRTAAAYTATGAPRPLRPQLSCLSGELLLSVPTARFNYDGEGIVQSPFGELASHSVVTDIYVANDPDDPTSWSPRGRIASDSPGYFREDRFDEIAVGEITEMESGRWVCSCAYGDYHGPPLLTGPWRVPAGTSLEQQAAPYAGIWYSDDRGATWTKGLGLPMQEGSSYCETAGQIELDPASGKLFWAAEGTFGGDGMYTSTNGADWTYVANDIILSSRGFVSDGDHAFVMWSDGKIRRVDDLTSNDYSGFPDVGHWYHDPPYPPPGEFISSAQGRRGFVTAAGRAFYFYNDGTVAFDEFWVPPATGGWIVGAIGFGDR